MSENVGFKARLRERERERERETASKGWDRVELVTAVEQYVSGAKDLRFISREFQKAEDELRNERSTHWSRVETGGRDSHR